MLPYNHIIPINRQTKTPLYQQIATAMIDAIQNGILETGTSLPGTRILAKTLQVHRKTIISAYNELYAQSWIEINPRKKVQVAAVLPDLKTKAWKEDAKEEEFGTFFSSPTRRESNYPHRIIVNDGYPDIRLFPYDLLTREYRFSLKQKARQLMEDPLPPWGADSLRTILTSYLHKTRGIAAELNNIIITNGAQMGIFLAAVTLLKRGDHVVVGTPGYHLADDVFDYLGTEIHRIHVDEEGLDTKALENLCETKPIRLVYCIPHHHYPTTVPLSTKRRKHLLQLAQKYQFAIIEDDYDFEFQYDNAAYLPLYSMAKNIEIIYVGSFSKAISPYLRIGFMVSHAQLIEKAFKLRRIINIMGDEIMENTLTSLISNGDLSRHIKKATKIYRERRDYLAQLLDRTLGQHISFQIPNGGLALWIYFKKKFNLEKALTLGKSKNINLEGLDFMRSKNMGMRIGFASLNKEELQEVVDLLVLCFE